MLRRFPKIDNARQIVFSRVKMPQFGILTHEHTYARTFPHRNYTISPYLNHEYVSRTKSKVVLPLPSRWLFLCQHFCVKKKRYIKLCKLNFLEIIFKLLSSYSQKKEKSYFPRSISLPAWKLVGVGVGRQVVNKRQPLTAPVMFVYFLRWRATNDTRDPRVRAFHQLYLIRKTRLAGFTLRRA